MQSLSFICNPPQYILEGGGGAGSCVSFGIFIFRYYCLAMEFFYEYVRFYYLN